MNKLEIELERGTKEGEELVFEGESDEGPDYDAGDVLIRVRSGTTQPGFVQRIKGEGMPVRNPNEGSVWKEEDGFGDLFVQYEVVLPEKIEGDLKKVSLGCSAV
ncbi:hypothetical protein L7F22_048542 [Adiantum nelumboides]|nr:hypothetical protein [Adiantum nelumboides]